jgi:zinc/manganese transport system substrate-binding protein
MSRRFVLSLLFAGLLGALPIFAACGGDDDDDEGISVVATTTQIGALVREVAGDNVRLTVLLQAGADAHDFEPSAQDAVTINRADLVLMNGIGLDEWVERMIEGAGSADKVVIVTDGIEVFEGAGHDDDDDHEEDDEDHEDEGDDYHGDDDHPHDEGDPHVWHDPANVKIMVRNIVAALSAADAANASTYQANGSAYEQKLDEVDAEIRALFAEIPEGNRKLVTNHDAFGYFIRAYGLEFVGAVIPSVGSGAQPSARELAALSDLIRSEGVLAIFAEAEVDPRVAQQLANDTGVQIVSGLYADSLGEPGSGAETVHGMLLFNARKIAEALK